MNDRSRPKAAPGGVAAANPIVAHSTDRTAPAWPDYLVRALAQMPPEVMSWAALAYMAGTHDGAYRLRVDLEEAGRAAARLARPVLRRPTFAELQARRGEAQR